MSELVSVETNYGRRRPATIGVPPDPKQGLRIEECKGFPYPIALRACEQLENRCVPRRVPGRLDGSWRCTASDGRHAQRERDWAGLAGTRRFRSLPDRPRPQQRVMCGPLENVRLSSQYAPIKCFVSSEARSRPSSLTLSFERWKCYTSIGQGGMPPQALGPRIPRPPSSSRRTCRRSPGSEWVETLPMTCPPVARTT